MVLSVHRILFLLALALWPSGAKSQSPEAEIKKSQLEIPAAIENDPEIRIALTQSSPDVLLSTGSAFHVFDGEKRLLFKGSQIEKTKVQAAAEGVRMGRQTFNRLPLTVDAGDAVLQINQRSYRSRLEFSKTQAGKLLIVNQVGLEDYLRGVLPWEANPKWSQESLKAQAVASRTYALFKIIENQNEAFSVSNDILSQVYGGVTLEKESTNRAIEATRGQVLVYGGRIFPAFFHSTCGGATTRAENVWPIQPHPALRGGTCGFCGESPHYRWKETFSAAVLRQALKKLGFNVSEIRNIRTEGADPSGRAQFFAVEHPAGKLKIPASDFRLALGPMKFKSVLMRRIWKSGSSFVFEGRGWGHGVGMCQYGVKKMGELGYSYKQILDYYYPGAEIITLAPGPSSPKS